MCSIAFSSLEDENDIDTFIYDSVNFESENPGKSEMHVNSDHSSLDSNYEKFLNERNEGIETNSPHAKTAIDFSLNSNPSNTLDLRV